MQKFSFLIFPANVVETVAISGVNFFHIVATESSRFSLRPAKKLHRGLIGSPENDLRHIGHVGYDGAVFGDVSFIGDNYSKLPIRVSSTQVSQGSDSHSYINHKCWLKS